MDKKIPQDNVSEIKPVRASSRERKETEKMSQFKEDELIKKERLFYNCYGAFKSVVCKTREIAKDEIKEEELRNAIANIETHESKLIEAYKSICAQRAPSQVVKTKMDQANAVSRDTLNTLEEIIGSLNGPFVKEDRLELMDGLLKPDYARSIFGSTVSKYFIRSNPLAKIQLELEAEVAAKTTELKKNDAIETQRLKLKRLEEEKEIESLKARLEVYQRSNTEEDSRMLDFDNDNESLKGNDVTNQNKGNLKGYHPDRPVNQAEQREVSFLDVLAQMSATNQNKDDLKGYHPDRPVNQAEQREVSFLDGVAQMSDPPQTYEKVQNVKSNLLEEGTVASNIDENKYMSQVLSETIQRSRLPTPVPAIFNGNPLEYMDFERSFKCLIESRNLPPTERLYYLKQYLTGPAKEAVEGCFYGSTEDAYDQAWTTLKSRYGHPFKVQQAFRQKLDRWPKINPRDATALQKFADFLKSCNDAKQYVHGLHILDDCLENQKLLLKLPDWIATRWNRTVTDCLDSNGSFPSFNDFSKFVMKEARVANNPISSMYVLRGHEGCKLERGKSGKQDVPNKKTVTLATGSKPNVNGTQQKPCGCCSEVDHRIENCPRFTSMSLSERKNFVRENKMCYGCLRKGHYSKECKRRHLCNKCSKRHPTLLHDDDLVRSTLVAPEPSVISCKVLTQEDQISTSMIVPVWVATEDCPSSSILTYALLDTQSDSSFVLDSIADALLVHQQPVRLSLSTMTNSSSIDSSVVCNLIIRGLSEQVPIKLNRCYTRSFIPVDRSHIPTSSTATSWPHLQHIASEMSALQDCDVGLLIGYNCSQALAPRKSIVGQESEPYAVKTDLGWSIIGSHQSKVPQLSSQCMRVSTKEIPMPTPQEILKVLESDFAERHSMKAYSQEDVLFTNILNEGIHVSENGHLQMPLPFKERPSLPNNQKLAEIRFQHLVRKFNRNPELKEEYISFMKELLKNGYAEPVTSIAAMGSVNFIPHHGVYHPRKRKLRVVFDCSAKYAGLSLNQYLLKGPDLTNSLVGVLCRFREHEVAVTCDIEKMFFQFKVDERDRSYLQFLWFKDCDPSKEVVPFRMTVHLFGASSSPSCANFGLKYLAQLYHQEYPMASKFLQRNFYVDDGLISTATVGEAIKLVEESRALCTRGGIRLHKFLSNSEPVLKSIPISERAEVVNLVQLDFDEIPKEKTLGITWSPSRDTIHFEVTVKSQPQTRRGILSTVASLYDPLGFVAPVVLVGKGILQEMCKSKLGWDDPLPLHLIPRWEHWLSDLEDLKDITINRCYHPKDFGEPIQVELHHFADASTNGYGQCSYLRLVNQHDKVHCSLLFAKARVAPSKVVTIPRLELTAAVIAVKVSCMIKEELSYKDLKEFFWTDSMVVLGYINNEARKFHTFVANRVQLIRDQTTGSQWRYIKGEENPADHASRGLSPSELAKSNWFDGPQFLWEKEIIKEDYIAPALQPEDVEVRTLTLASRVSTTANIEYKFTKFSEWSRLLTAFNFLRRIAKGSHSSSLEDRKNTEIWIIKVTQESVFSEERFMILHEREIPRSSHMFSLQPFIDQAGVIRVGGRLINSSMPEAVKHPVVLSKAGHVSKLIVKHFHEKICHQGRGQTINAIRSHGYWIINCSKLVNEVIRTCVKCRRMRRPLEEQKMANLPEVRTEPSAPFTFVGMDCFGPFKIKKGRSEAKRYGLLFTCLCSRAVHIEMIDDLSTDVFINGLRCFIAIRGAVKEIRCDQGSNFVGADNELNSGMSTVDTEKVKTHLHQHHCEFVFNTPSASHAGGIWERQIRTIRSVLKATIDLCPGRLDDSSLRTLFYEAMAIVNSRPLSPVNISDPCAEPPITPNHLITMKGAIPPAPPGEFITKDLYARKRWRRVQYLLNQFWSKWRKEYLLNLNKRQKWNIKRRNVMIGDVVIINDNSPRMEWPIGIVTEANPDNDGLVRKVKLSLATNELDKNGKRIRKTTVLERPIQKIVVLLEAKKNE